MSFIVGMFVCVCVFCVSAWVRAACMRADQDREESAHIQKYVRVWHVKHSQKIKNIIYFPTAV